VGLLIALSAKLAKLEGRHFGGGSGAVVTAIFFIVGSAMLAGMGGSRGIATGLFCLGLVASVAWFAHHVTTHLSVAL
jgi:hypothetical protein